MSYNDYVRERDRWEAKGKVPKGTRRFMYNPYNGKFEYWVKGDDALLKMIESKSLKEVLAYEQNYTRARNNVLRVSNKTGNSKGQVPTNTSIRGGLGNNASSYGGGAKNGGTNAARSGKQNNGYNNGTKGQTVNNKRSAENGGAFSDAKNQKARSTIASEKTVPITAPYSAGASADNNISHGNKNVKTELLLSPSFLH